MYGACGTEAMSCSTTDLGFPKVIARYGANLGKAIHGRLNLHLVKSNTNAILTRCLRSGAFCHISK